MHNARGVIMLCLILTGVFMASVAYSEDCSKWHAPQCEAKFGPGYCTQWVANKASANGTPLTFSGDANQWLANAKAKGYQTGQPGSTPVPGSIAVLNLSSYGHVAWVESVTGNTFTVSEWNNGLMSKTATAIEQCCVKTVNYGHMTTTPYNINDSRIKGFIYLGNKPSNTTNAANGNTKGAVKKNIYTIRIDNIDDTGECHVNGVKVASVGYYQDTGWVDITRHLHSGENEIVFKVKNVKGGYAYNFRLRENDELKWHADCGEVGKKGCPKDKLSSGQSLTKKVKIKI